jgi:predicted O-methyltransferase YrrM
LDRLFAFHNPGSGRQRHQSPLPFSFMNNKLSLCMIVGNVENYIDRCLSSFKVIADEIVVVRAIGNQKPDKTLDIARDKFGAITGEYFNAPEHSDWPHVDSFAAARQKSFDMATNDYCMWCDSDDVLEAGADVVRDLLDRAEFAAYVFPYKIFGRGVSVPRERMMLKSSGYWKNPVHECFEFHVKNPTATMDDRVVITHLPYSGGKGDSHSRNLRILRSIPEDQMTGGQWYHMAGELAAIGKETESLEACKKALADPTLGKPEKYEIYMNLARISEEPNTRAALLHQAYAADPERREALGLLAHHEMDYGTPRAALAYARQMMATIRPNNGDWNERAGAYGWLGNDIYCQALRCNGAFEAAEDIRKATLAEAGGARITLIHATRGRPQRAAIARKLWLDMAAQPERIEHIFCIDADDKESYPLRRMHHVMVPYPDAGCVMAWNVGAGMSSGQVLVQMSDDFVPPAQWDNLICDRIGDLNKEAVLAVSDGLRADKLMCMAICTRKYWQRDYLLLHPDFKSMYSDNWFTDQAYKRGCVIEARDIVFQHDHPILHGKWDETYVKQNAPERYEDGAKILQRLRDGKDWSACHGWFNYYPLYWRQSQLLKDGDSIVEIGVWQGRSLIYMAQRLKQMGKKVKIYAVDTFKGDPGVEEHMNTVASHGGSIRAAFEANLKRCEVDDMVEIIESDSAAAASRLEDKSVAFCFIDASHDYDSVKKDVAAWLPKIKTGGTMSGHDAQHEPVRKAVREVLGGKARIFDVVWIAENLNT